MSERIRKLAKKYDRSIEDVVAALTSMGEARYRQADDLIPDALLGPLDKAIRKLPAARPALPAKSFRLPAVQEKGGRVEPLPQSIPDDPGLNAALQDYLAASPLAELKKSLTDKSKAVPSAVPTAPSTETVLRDSLGAEIHRRRLAEDALAEARHELVRIQHARQESLQGVQQALAVGQAERDRLQMLLDEQSAECIRMRAELEAERQRSALLEKQVVDAQEESRQQNARVETLHAQLQAELASRMALETKLTAALAAATPAGPASRSTTGAADALPLKSPLFPSAPSAQVENSSNREKAAREFLQVCRDRGFTQINVVGGSPKYWQELQALLPGITLRCVDGTAGMDQARARRQVEGADVTLIWGSSILSHRVSACYTDLKDPSVLTIHHRGLEGLLRDAAAAIARLSTDGQP